MSIDSNLADLRKADVVVTDGGIETWIDFNSDYDLGDLGTIGMLDDGPGRAVLVDLETRYIKAARKHDLEIVIGTPSWHGSVNRLVAAGHPEEDVERLNRSAVWLVRALRREVAHGRGFVAAVMGPFGDGYRPEDSLNVEQARSVHQRQANALADAEPDFLFAVPLPAADEAVGICQAMAASGAAYVPSFLIGADGRLPDGTPLGEAIGRILSEVDIAPLHVSVSCVHPRTFVAGYQAAQELVGADNLRLVAELKANGSDLPKETLDGSKQLHSDDPVQWAADMVAARDAANLRIVGGCCGTDERHIAALAAALTS
ncbi:MAG: homocysteine S-methyltransferase family protein [Candidatus Nanopelagicales bacterium]